MAVKRSPPRKTGPSRTQGTALLQNRPPAAENPNMLPFAAILLLAIQSPRAGDAISCYECNSKFNNACASENPSQLDLFKTDCSTKVNGNIYTFCRKIHQVIEIGMIGLEPDTRVIRSCGWVNSSTPCYFRTFYGGEINVCSCTNNLCNSAAIPEVTFLSVLAVMTLPILMR